MKIYKNFVLAVMMIFLPHVHYCSQDSFDSELAREEWGPIPTMVGERDSSLLQDLIVLCDQFVDLGELQVPEKEYCWEEDLLERCEDFWMSFDNER